MGDKHIQIERILKAAPERIWRCWTEPKLIEQWYCPKPLSLKVLKQELHTGGKMQLQFSNPNSEGFTKCGLILDCVPNKKFTFTDAFVEAWIPSNRALHVISIELEDLGNGTTKYCHTARYWSVEDAQTQTNNGYLQGSNIAIDQLEALLASDGI